MTMKLPDTVQRVLRPLFDMYPPQQAMRQLVVDGGDAAAQPPEEAVQLVAQLVQEPALADQPALIAGLWLYVDELDRSHNISQQLHSPTGSFWHGIMHRREGDFSNSHYWFRKAGKHPAMNRIDFSGGPSGAGTDVAKYDPHNFIDRVERAYRNGETAHDLIALQQQEWLALFEWCAGNK